MQSIQTRYRNKMAFALPEAFFVLGSSNIWEGVEFTDVGASKSWVGDIFSIGPIFRVTGRNKGPVIMFAPNFRHDLSEMKQNIMKLCFSLDASLFYVLKFQDNALLMEFLKFFTESQVAVCDLAYDLSFTGVGLLEEEVQGMLPGSSSFHGVLAQLWDTEISFVRKTKKKQVSTTAKRFSFDLRGNMVASLLLPKNARKKARKIGQAADAFAIFDGTARNDVFLVMPSEKTAIKWILATHISQLRSRMTPAEKRACAQRIGKEKTKTEEPVAIVPIMIESVEIAPESPVDAPAENSTLDEVRHELPKVETVDVRPVVADRAGARSPPGRRRVIAKRQGRIMVMSPVSNRDRPTFLPDGRTNGSVERWYDAFVEDFQVVTPEPIVIPTWRSLAVGVDLEKASCEERDVERMIAAVVVELQDEQSELETMTRATTDEIVAATLARYDPDQPVDFSTVIDFASFSAGVSASDLADAPCPETPFVTEITSVAEQIRARDTNILSIDMNVSKKLVFMVASLLLNGLRGFRGLSDKDCLLPAMREFAKYFSGFEEIVTRASGEADVAGQASVIAELLLNRKDVVPFLRQILRRDTWVEKYYRPSAQIASETVVEMMAVLLTPIMTSSNFSLTVNPKVVVNTSADFVFLYIDVPAFGYLEMASVATKQELVAALSDQLMFGMKCEKSSRSDGPSAPFMFIYDVASQTDVTRTADWDVFAVATKKLMEERPSTGIPLHETWLQLALDNGDIVKWLLYLILSRSIVEKYFNGVAAFRDMYRANYILTRVARFAK